MGDIEVEEQNGTKGTVFSTWDEQFTGRSGGSLMFGVRIEF